MKIELIFEEYKIAIKVSTQFDSGKSIYITRKGGTQAFKIS